MTTEKMTDRELDAWLAEHLFGWEWVPQRVDILAGGFWRSPDGEHHQTPNQHDFWDCAYSSTGDGMLMVLEAMRERGWSFQLSDGLTETSLWVALFESDRADHQIYADSLPRAVAEAAKAALEEEG